MLIIPPHNPVSNDTFLLNDVSSIGNNRKFKNVFAISINTGINQVLFVQIGKAFTEIDTYATWLSQDLLKYITADVIARRCSWVSFCKSIYKFDSFGKADVFTHFG